MVFVSSGVEFCSVVVLLLVHQFLMEYPAKSYFATKSEVGDSTMGLWD